MKDDLEQEQIRRETEGVAQARDRFWESLGRSALAESRPGAILISRAFPALVEAIRAEQKRIKEGAKPWYWQRLVSVEADKLAMITLMTVVTSVGEKEDSFTKATMLARRIGEWCEAERLYGTADRGKKEVVEAILRRNRRRRNARRSAPKILVKLEAKASPRTLIRLGGVLLKFAIEHTDLIEKRVRSKQPTWVHFTEKATQDLEGILRTLEAILVPRHTPMIVPPRPWVRGRKGGYLRIEIPFVKREGELEVGDALERADLRIPSEAVNAIQETPWRINEAVADVMRIAWERKSPREALPSWELPPLPPLLPKDSTPPEEFDRRIMERGKVWRKRDQAVGNQIAMTMRLKLAQDLRRFKEFYIVGQCDHRGRVYSVPQIVHPQADDMGRALLQFARGKPIGEKEAEWLAVYVANLAGKDKLPLKKRSGWVRENQEEIVAWAKRPLEGGRFWKEADKPWRFFAAAHDWAGYVAHGAGYVSCLPIAMDGTCNCLQHLSALGRDPVGGRSTNVVPSEGRQDIYGEVAEELRKPVALDAAGGHEIAKLALDIVTRKLVKQATMTTPYGVTEKGLRDQLVQVIGESWPDRFPDDYVAAAYLASHLDQAISRVVVKGAEIRAWLRSVVEQLAGKGLGLSWVLPTGFPVVHHYLAEAKHRVRTLVGTQLIFEEADDAEINATKQANAIVANVVHSLDAAHMMETVCALKALGITDLSMVHDSYAVHAAYVEVMNRVLREKFIRVHTELTLATFVEQIRKQAPGVAIPDPPAPGALDLADVMKSEYFFS